MFVVKVGGSRGINLEYVIKDLADLSAGGEKFVLVHGVSEEMNEMSSRLGKPVRTITSPSGYVSRYTDKETMDIFGMVSAKIRNKIVEAFQQRKVNALGLSGVDGRLLEGKRKDYIRSMDEKGRILVIRDDYTGRVEEVNVPLLNSLLRQGYVPIVSPMAVSHESEAINVDGDRAAAIIAGALGFCRLIIISNTAGLLRDPEDESSLIQTLTEAKIDETIEKFARGRMKKKLLGAKEAFSLGVKEVILADGRIEFPVSIALSGRGTVIR